MAAAGTMRRSAALALLMAVLSASSGAEEWIYRVKPGDNLWNFTQEHLTSMRFVERLQTLNQVQNPRRLPPGSRLRVPMAWLKLEPARAHLEQVAGEVTGTDGAGDALVLAPGLALGIGTQIRTGADGTVVLRFADESRYVLRESGELVLDALSAYGTTGMVDTRLRLDRGRSRAQVTPATGPGSQFIITTPAAVAAVRGTVERIRADGEITVAEVTEGSVALSGAGRTRSVPAGFGTRARTGEPPEVPRRLLAAPDLTGLPPRLERLPPQLSWPEVNGAAAYRVQVASDRRFESLLADTVVPVPRLRGVDLADGEYFLRARAIDPDGIEGLDAIAGFTLDARPEPPFAQAPGPGATVRDTLPTFLWSQPADAVSYRFQLARDPGLSERVVEHDALGEPRLQSAVDAAFGDYHWRLATRNAGGEVGPWGDVQAFTLKPSPPQPQTEAPAIEETQIGFRWSAAEPGQRHRFQLARDPSFETLVHDEELDEPGIVVPRPEGGTYYLRVATLDTDGYQGPYSTVQSVEVPIDSWWHLIAPGAGILLFLLL